MSYQGTTISRSSGIGGSVSARGYLLYGMKRWPLLSIAFFAAVVIACLYLLSRYFFPSPSSVSLPSATSSSSDIDTGIIILGGGLTSTGDIPEHTQLRVNKAIEMYHRLGENAYIIPLSGGTPHKPNPLDERGFPIWEASAAAKKLMALGVSGDHILEENFSLDTIGNVSERQQPHASLRFLC